MAFSLNLRQLFAVLCCVAGFSLTVPVALAQSGNGKPAEQQKPPADAAKETQKKIDEIAEATRVLSGPAGNPECVWLGRRVVSLLWRGGPGTAFRPLPLFAPFFLPPPPLPAPLPLPAPPGKIRTKA